MSCLAGCGQGASGSDSAGSSSGSAGASSASSGSSSAGTTSSSGGGSSTASTGSSSSGGGSSTASTGSSTSSSTTGSSSSSSSGTPGTCGYGDTNLPPEPAYPTVCATLVADKATPDESDLDTAKIQAALSGCPAGQAVKLTSSGANNSFVSGPLKVSGVTLWVDAGATLYASRTPSLFGAGCTLNGAANACGAFLTVTGTSPGLVGAGVIDGQGGELLVGQTESWWDVSDALASSNGSAAAPALVSVSANGFVMHDITLHNSSKFHVKLSGTGFVVWGVTILTPSKPTNAAGHTLSSSLARNTDGIDPGGSLGAEKGFIVCSKISVGDDQIAIKGSSVAVSGLTIAHNHFGTGHGMSIGSETNAGVSDVQVYDLTIDGTVPTGGAGSSSINGIRIKSDASAGGLVTNVTYTDICTRNLFNPILLNPRYSSAAGTLIPLFTNITIKDFHDLGGVSQKVTLDGYDSSHDSSITFDNVFVDGSPTVTAANAKVTLGPGSVSFVPSGTNVVVTDKRAGATTPIDCTNRWVTF